MKGWQGCAVGAGEVGAPAAHSFASPRPAQSRMLERADAFKNRLCGRSYVAELASGQASLEQRARELAFNKVLIQRSDSSAVVNVLYLTMVSDGRLQLRGATTKVALSGHSSGDPQAWPRSHAYLVRHDLVYRSGTAIFTTPEVWIPRKTASPRGRLGNSTVRNKCNGRRQLHRLYYYSCEVIIARVSDMLSKTVGGRTRASAGDAKMSQPQRDI